MLFRAIVLLAAVLACARPAASEAAKAPRPEQMVRRVKPKLALKELTLAEPQARVLKEVVEQARPAGKKGVRVLLAGAGTAGGRIAEALAGETKRELWRVDLESVVSKYVGETEKNLSRLFAAAESANCILFFDEADALFGKRTGVKDSHDRYANMETNYLLQRIEEYHGIVILATNMRVQNSAPARRFTHVVKFPPE